ncbi:hypothetical protein [Methanoculleus sp. 7T]|uniref:hypothetical protein n=1 Tax=Methanoculleus sp. 7T TaxID=2937282 RepID=UPI0020BDD814|nr:hypothetical protein [Methanoculleus sp. 7T]MCK8518524.1 hypothetical protein [Methanoculleus sp. 7T]
MAEDTERMIVGSPRPPCFQWRVMMIQACIIQSKVMMIVMCTSATQDIKFYRKSTEYGEEMEKQKKRAEKQEATTKNRKPGQNMKGTMVEVGSARVRRSSLEKTIVRSAGPINRFEVSVVHGAVISEEPDRSFDAELFGCRVRTGCSRVGSDLPARENSSRHP